MKHSAKIPEEFCGKRLDQAVSELWPEYSRARLQRWIRQGYLTLDGAVTRPRQPVMGGELVEVEVESPTEETSCEPQDLPITIVYKDDDIILVEKKAGMVVHPAAGNYSGTLQNALLYHFPDLASIPRAGIVHRLDKDTSGLMVVARSLRAHSSLVQQLQTRRMGREYEALVHGVLVAGGTVDEPIGRHPVDRKRMAVTRQGKPAVTHYRVLEKFNQHTHIRVSLETGRTHQIRVHMAHIRYPLVGDPVYGGRRRIPPGASQRLIQVLNDFPRQALHAVRLQMQHPASDELVSWKSNLPEDMQRLIDVLRQESN